MKPKIKISNIIGHFKTIIIHKYWVGRYCFLAGLYWRGIKHDISKFSPTEFFESVRYYTGERSPINVCKEINGISYSWLHHKARNDHHYLYWQDNFDPDKVPTHVHMPYKPLVESICDSLGAARTYLGDGFSYYKEYKWYFNELDNMAMNDTDKRLALYTVFLLAFIEEKYGYVDPVKIRKVFKKYLYEAYNNGLKHPVKLWKYFYDHTIISKTFVDCSINKELEADKRYYDYTLSKLYEEEREEVLFNER